MDLSADDIREFLVEKHVRRECVICGANDWALLSSSRPDAVPFIGTVDPLTGLMISRPYWKVTGIVCLNCGNTHLLQLLTIEEWKKAKEEAKKNGK